MKKIIKNYSNQYDRTIDAILKWLDVYYFEGSN